MFEKWLKGDHAIGYDITAIEKIDTASVLMGSKLTCSEVRFDLMSTAPAGTSTMACLMASTVKMQIPIALAADCGSARAMGDDGVLPGPAP